MKLALALLFTVLAPFALGAEAGPASPRLESRFLLIPILPPDQKPTAGMQVVLRRLNEDGSLLKLDAWDRLPDLPAWVFEKGKGVEIAYLGEIPAVAMDAFRYAVISAKDREIIVVRAGGIAGVYEVFQRKKPKQ